MDIQTALRTVVEGRDLTREQMVATMRIIMTGQATPAQIGGFLVGLRMKGETIDEITAAADVMRELATPVHVNKPHLVDIVGTGGDSASTFNISTTSALVVAAAGGSVAKHGNRSVSSKSGSADVLEALGVKLTITPEQVAQCVEQVGIGFMFAPQHHSAMKHAIGPRREMGIRTLFNLLGPLTNPAKASCQLMGVFDRRWIAPLAKSLKNLGSEHALVVHSEDGLDEISIAAPTFVAELHQGEISTYTLTPEELGLTRSPLDNIKVSSVEESVTMVKSVLDNTTGTAKDIVSLNAGAAIYAAGMTETLQQGVDKARMVIENGQAREKLAALVALTQSFD